MIWENPNVNTFFFDICVFAISIYVVMLFYLAFYLPLFCKIDLDDAEAYAPKIIPIAAIAGLVVFVTANLALLPVWGWLTFPIIIILFVGFTMTAHFLPGGYLGSFLMIALLFSLSATSHYIPHDGLWDIKETGIQLEAPEIS